jgi:hypothetical protein
MTAGGVQMQGRWIVAVAAMVGITGVPAAAQDTYVSASLTADVVRFSGSETPGVADLTPDGEALGFAVRLGTRLGSAWGVEAEVSRAAEIERESEPDAIPFPRPTDPIASIITDGRPVVPGVDVRIVPPVTYRMRSAYRDLTVSAGVWARQDFTARFALVYSGGVGFHRSEREAELTIAMIGLIPEVPGLIFPPTRTVTDVTTYSARPFAGIEGRVRMTEQVELVPGVRVHGLEAGLLVRPSIGVGWLF